MQILDLVELEFGLLISVEGGKPGEPREKPSQQGENSTPTWYRATLVEGERYHHCITSDPTIGLYR